MGRRGLGGRHDGGGVLFAMVPCGCDSGTRVKSWVFAATRANGASKRFRIDETDCPRMAGMELRAWRWRRGDGFSRGRVGGNDAWQVPLDCATVCQLSTVKMPNDQFNSAQEAMPCPNGHSVQPDQIADRSMRGGILIAMARPCHRQCRRLETPYGLFPGRDAMVGVWRGNPVQKKRLQESPSNPRCGPSALSSPHQLASCP
jgi:hypothetical protein